MVFLARDITESKQMEESLIHSHKMEMMGQMAGGVAHDFNNLLTVIMGNLEFLRDGIGDSDETENRIMIDNAINAAKNGAQLTQSLLTISRQQALQPKHINIDSVVKSFIRLASRTLGKPSPVDLYSKKILRSKLSDNSLSVEVRSVLRDAIGGLEQHIENDLLEDDELFRDR